MDSRTGAGSAHDEPPGVFAAGRGDEAAHTRSRTTRRVWIGVGLVLGALLAFFGTRYFGQAVSFATHLKGPPEHTYPVTTFPPGAQPLLRFAAVGDIGDGGDEESEVAAAMQIVSAAHPYDALLLLGDNVYPAGDPARLDQTVFVPFGPLLGDGAELYAVLGNHDILAPDGGADEMVRLGMPGNWWSVRRGDVLLIGLDSNRPDDPDQLSWLEVTLAGTDATWRIVMLHHAPFSAGYQGSTKDVRRAFTPLFEEYGVQLVLSGHEHDYERSVPINGVTYVVTGGGSEFRRTGTEGFTAYSTATFHYTDIDVFADHIYVQAIDSTARRFDDVVIAP